jgi:hypothetical protein
MPGRASRPGIAVKSRSSHKEKTFTPHKNVIPMLPIFGAGI